MKKLLVTQYEGSVIEDTGLIKMDFLGLKTLSIIKEAIENIKHSKGIILDIDEVDISDPPTYALIVKDGRLVHSSSNLPVCRNICGNWNLVLLRI